MVHLIDKDALVAAIERIKSTEYNEDFIGDDVACCALDMVIDAVNNLEVKEVDLEKEIDRYYGMYRKNGITYDVSDNETCFDWKNDELAEHEMRLAKHFFELGLNAQKGK